MFFQNGQRAKQLQDWRAFQKAQYADLQGVGSMPGGGGAMLGGESAFARSPMGIYSAQQGGAAGRDAAYQKKRGGGFTARYGESVSDADLDKYLQANGIEAPYNGAGQRTTTVHSRAQSPPLGTSTYGVGSSLGGSMVDQYLAGIKSQYGMANMANEQRYKQVLDSKNSLMGNVEQHLDSWGETRRKLNEERSAETLGDINANLSSRGLGNSTRGGAFQERNARDLDFLQQDLAERKDIREVNYMTGLTQDRDAFVERRTDEVPDVGAAMQLAAQMGESGMGGQRRPSVTSPTGYTTTTTRSGPDMQYDPMYNSVWGRPQEGGGGAVDTSGLFPAAEAIKQAYFGGGQRAGGGGGGGQGGGQGGGGQGGQGQQGGRPKTVQIPDRDTGEMVDFDISSPANYLAYLQYLNTGPAQMDMSLMQKRNLKLEIRKAKRAASRA